MALLGKPFTCLASEDKPRMRDDRADSRRGRSPGSAREFRNWQVRPALASHDHGGPKANHWRHRFSRGMISGKPVTLPHGRAHSPDDRSRRSGPRPANAFRPPDAAARIRQWTVPFGPGIGQGRARRGPVCNFQAPAAAETGGTIVMNMLRTPAAVTAVLLLASCGGGMTAPRQRTRCPALDHGRIRRRAPTCRRGSSASPRERIS